MAYWIDVTESHIQSAGVEDVSLFPAMLYSFCPFFIKNK